MGDPRRKSRLLLTLWLLLPFLVILLLWFVAIQPAKENLRHAAPDGTPSPNPPPPPP